MSISIPKVPTRIPLPKKLPTDLPTTLRYIKDLQDALQFQNSQVTNIVNGANGADVLVNRPLAGIRGRTYYATDNSHFYVDNGTAWIQLL